MKKLARRLINTMGYDLARRNGHPREVFTDIKEEEFWELYELCRPYTMTSTERMYALYQSMRYVLDAGIEGAFVECGVWRGGSSMLMAQMLANRGISDREIWLYDTFEGMTEPSEHDVAHDGQSADEMMVEEGYDEAGKSNWCHADLVDVQSNIGRTSYEFSKVAFIEGMVEETMPASMPEGPIALLRLDTDWYDSTKHELIHLYPKLVNRGVLVIDDYGFWEGARKAVDEYFADADHAMLLNRVDLTGRVGIKLVG